MAHLDAAPVALVGRATELDTLSAFLDGAAVDGSPLVVTGDPGVGKTALLSSAEGLALDRGFRVVAAAGIQYESDVSFAGLHQIVDPMGDALGRLPSTSQTAIEVAIGRGSGPPPDRLTVLDATLTMLRRAASDAPLLLVIDDLHWLDRASASLVGSIGRRLRGSGIGLLGATRSDRASFFERAGMPQLEVRPLSEEASLDLLKRTFVHLPTRVARQVVDDARGNPLALLEFAATAPNLETPRCDPAVSGVTNREVHALYLERIEALPASTKRLLLLAALEGSGELRLLTGAAGTSDLQDLGPAEADHLIAVDDRTAILEFRHPMIKSAIVESSTREERSVAHRRLASALTDQPELRGHHLAQATHSPDAEVAAAIEKAAHLTLERGDVVGAVSKLLRAAELSPDPEGRGRRLADAAFIGAHSAGQLDRSLKLLREARRRDPGFESTLHAAVATAYLLLNSEGDGQTAYRLLVDAIESALDDNKPDLEGLAEGLYTLAILCHYAARVDFWPAYHRAMDRLGSAAPMQVQLLAATFADPARASAEALAALDEEIRQLGSIEDDGAIVRTAIAAFYVDRLTQCREPLLRIIDDGRGGGAVGSAMMAMSIMAHEELNAGRWDEAARYATEAKTLWDERGYRLYGFTSHYALALIAANRGDLDTCRRECDGILEWAAPRQLGIFTDWANHALARATLGSGDFEEAYVHASAITPPGTLLPHKPQALWSAFDLVEAAYRSGRISEAGAHAEALQAAHVGRLSARYALIADAAVALVADDAAAAARFETALGHPGIDRWPFDVARVRLAYGERLRRLRRTREARRLLQAAHDGFESLGAQDWARRAATELAATAASRHTSMEPGARSLTPHEQEVAMLAATGLTNKQIAAQLFMSPRTVSAHLYRVFPKLGITTRAALRDALHEHENRPGH